MHRTALIIAAAAVLTASSAFAGVSEDLYYNRGYSLPDGTGGYYDQRGDRHMSDGMGGYYHPNGSHQMRNSGINDNDYNLYR